jgi:protocatechuate 3,4-dioxygenase beta subunit
MNEELEDHDRGLSHDLSTLLSRRKAIGLFGGVGIATALAACSSGSKAAPSSSTAAASTAASTSSASAAVSGSSSAATGGTAKSATELSSGGSEIPEETNGPFPADGSNGVDILSASGIVRSDIRSSFGTASAIASGVPLTVTLTVVDVSSSDSAGTAVRGAAVYAWHCDRDGNYSMYSAAAKAQNYLRGIQETDGNGTVTFTSIFPACYSGRWPHIHFEIYPSLADATKASNRIRTSQLALPKDVCDTVYATSGYEQSVTNLKRTSLSTDMVFSDGYSLQLAKVTGSVSAGYQASLRVPI